MSPELWASIEEAYQRIADLEPGDWPAALERVDDPAVREEVRLLLHAGPMPTQVGTAIASATLEAAAANTSFGPWRTGQLIGHGGAGAVYEAVRDDKGFEQRAALKVLQTRFDPIARERFEQERRILASLNHPCIARLIDGGETPSGLPYIVIEFVEGRPVTDWANGTEATREEILRLFLKICSGVEYAHQRLIVHRDLKPANILVTADGSPKLLDFGIAKLLGESEIVTQTGFMPLTPSYASPEQVMGTAITTATDVYSLGVVLYELLTGHSPIDLPTTTSPIAITRAICEAPVRSPHIHDDLDNVLLMALRKEPERRYPSVTAFANDIENYLGKRVVTAREDSVWYRTTRFVQRHATSVSAAAAVVIALTAAVISTEYQARRAQRHFEITRNLANDVLLSIDKELSQIPAATEPRRNLIRTVVSTLERLYRDTGNDRRLEAELAVAYERAGGLQSTLPNGEPRQSLERSIELGERVRAKGEPDSRLMEALARAYYLLGIRHYELNNLELARKNLSLAIERGRDPLFPPQDATLVAGAARWLGRMENETGRVAEAVRWMEQAVEAAEKSVQQSRTPNNVQELTSARSYLARSLSLSGNLIRAGMVAHRAGQDGLSIYRAYADDAEAKLAMVSGFIGPASGHAMPSDFAGPMAAPENVEVAVREAKAMTDVTPTVNYWWTWLVMAYLQQSRTAPDPAAATQAARQALTVAEKQVHVAGATRVTARNRALARLQLAKCLHRTGDTGSALEQSRVALKELASGPRDRDADVLAIDAALVLGSIEESSGNAATASAAFERARTAGEALIARDPTDMRTAAFLAMAYEGLGRCSHGGDGEAWFRKSVATWQSWPDESKAGTYPRDHLRQAQRWLAAARQ